MVSAAGGWPRAHRPIKHSRVLVGVLAFYIATRLPNSFERDVFHRSQAVLSLPQVAIIAAIVDKDNSYEVSQEASEKPHRDKSTAAGKEQKVIA